MTQKVIAGIATAVAVLAVGYLIATANSGPKRSQSSILAVPTLEDSQLA